MSSTATEEDIQAFVLRAQEGDTEAFGKVYDHFFDQIFRYAAFRVPEAVAEDVVADIFVKAWEKLHTYSAQKNVPFGAWLFRIARYRVIDSYRSKRALEEMPEDMEDTDVLNQAETRVKRRYLLQTVRGALSELPQRYREVLELSYMGGLPNPEIARVLRMREGAVRTLKSRALKKLEVLLPPETMESL